MFAAADWFHPEPREVEKTFSIDTFSEKSVTKCFCMVKKRLQKSNEEVNFKLSYTPCVEMGKELGCSLTVSRDIINDQTTLSVMVAEVVHVSETDETIIWPIERKFLNRFCFLRLSV